MNQTATTFIPDTAPFDSSQRLWLNGYMAGLLAGKHFPPSIANGAANGVVKPTVPLVILFGSQTGTAEKLAKQLAKDSKSRGCNARTLEANAHTGIDWSKETNLLVVTSTYGDGDMPDNAQGFWDWLQTDAAKAIAHVNFSVLALGDTNYEQFCAAGKKIDARLEALGARRIHPLEVCDLDYETKAKAWGDGALTVLAPAGPPAVAAVPAPDAAPAPAAFSKTNPFSARLITNLRLNGEGSQKETRHFEISLEGSGLNTAKGEMPLRQALTSFYDISRPSAELQKFFGERNPALAVLLAPERKDDLKKWLWGRGVIDFLVENPTIKISPKEFTALLKPIAPRLYSISSSPKAHAGQVHLTINVVRYETFGRGRKGVASTFLADRVNGEASVPVFIQTSHGFRPPADGDKPVIMVGPGTGVAPFRGFLHERIATGAKGKNWLFFGEQRAATDFYYREELEKMLATGHLTKLSTAFSRDQAEKIYVQTRMLENAAELWVWLEAGAHFYVCGDASRMAKDVDDALHKIIETAGSRSADDAKVYVAKLKTDKRYQRDVY
ncbi:MAG: sulfite reductase flavoprotein subunit alpha [Verrucomicrobia bacterium]|nr:sulfite reductase flavoprotein subunit alpha [Verrucomicrobiota bacterium]